MNVYFDCYFEVLINGFEYYNLFKTELFLLNNIWGIYHPLVTHQKLILAIQYF